MSLQPKMIKLCLAAVSSIALVLARQKMLNAAVRRGPEVWGPRWLAIGLGEFLRYVAYVVGVDFESDTIEKWQKDPEKRLDPNRQYLTCWHPHGALTFCAAFFTSKMAAESTTELASGPRNWFVAIATLLFRFPLIGEYLALVNARPVTQTMSDELLSKGRSLALQPGGLPEQIVTDHRKERLVFPPNLGFCRLALKHGTDMLPIYVFGENQVFTTYQWGRETTRALFRRFGVAVPLINPLPNKVTLYMKWGRPVEIPAAVADPEDALVHQVFAKPYLAPSASPAVTPPPNHGMYLLVLADLFQEHAAKCLPKEVADEGLHVVWRGHSKERLDQLLVSEAKGKEIPSCLHTGEGCDGPKPPPAKL